MIEQIVCAAMHIETGKREILMPENVPSGIIISGLRHFNCIGMRSYMGIPKTVENTQGFLTTRNRFVSRQEAYDIAVKSGQVDPERAHTKGYLYSEDLY